jgi:hypothetical protein
MEHNESRTPLERELQEVDTTLPAIAPVRTEDLDLDNGWTDYRENVVKTYRMNALKYRYLHREAVKHYAFWRNIFEVVLILLGSLGTLLSIWSSAVTDQINKVLLWLSAFFSVLSKLLSYPQLQIQHTVAGKKFLELFNSAQIQLLAPRRQRAAAPAYIQDLLNSFTALEAAAPEVPKRIREDLRLHPERLHDLYHFDGDLTQGDTQEERVMMGATSDPAAGGFVRENNAELGLASPQLNENMASRMARIQLQRFNALTESSD